MNVLNNLSVIGLALIAVAVVIFLTLFVIFRLWNRRVRAADTARIAKVRATGESDDAAFQRQQAAERKFYALAERANKVMYGTWALAGLGALLYLVTRVIISYNV